MTASTLLVLAVGIGATAAVLSLIRAVLLAPPSFWDPARLVEFRECTLIFAGGGLLGLLIAYAGRGALAAMAAPYFDPVFEPRLDWRVVAASMAMAIGACVVCALAPALQARRTRLQEALQESSLSVMSGRKSRAFGSML